MPKRSPTKAFLYYQKQIAASTQKSGLEAQKLLVQALAIQPQNANALYLYSQCLQQRGQHKKSAQLLDRAQALNPCYFSTLDNNPKQIKSSIHSLFQSNQKLLKPDNPQSLKWQQSVNLYAKRKDLYTCSLIMDLFSKIKKADNSEYSPHTFSTFGITLYELGQYEDSLEKYHIACLLKPSQYRYYNNMAILQYIFGRFNESVELVQRSLGYNPGYAKSMFIMAFSLCRLGRAKQALEHVLGSIKKDPTMTMYRFKAITILLQYFPTETPQLQTHLSELQTLLSNNSDTDSYFFNKDNKPILHSALKFLQNCLPYREDGEIKGDWERFVGLLDDFLMKGHRDKYRIGGEMAGIGGRVEGIVRGKEEREREKEIRENQPGKLERMGEFLEHLQNGGSVPLLS